MDDRSKGLLHLLTVLTIMMSGGWNCPEEQGVGQIGLRGQGQSSLYFDSLHAVPLFPQHPFSAPAAY